MLQTAYGSLTVGLDIRPGQTLLIRGGTSSVGMAAAILAKQRGLTVLSTTRRPERAAALAAVGVDHPIVDDGAIADAGPRDRARTASTPRSSWSARRRCPTRCAPPASTASSASPGCSSNEWTVPDFYPIGYIPTGVRLTGYGGEAADLPAEVLQSFLDDVAAGRLEVPIDHVYAFDEIVAAHADMEAGSAVGKLVVLTESAGS